MKKLKLWQKTMIALFIGIVLGFIFSAMGGREVGWIAVSMKACSFVGGIYLRMLRMLSVPLVFACILNSVAKLGDLKQLTGLGIKTFLFFFVTSAISVVFGLIVTMLLKPGAGFTMEELSAASYEATAEINVLDSITNMFPVNIFASLTSGDMMQIIVFAIFAGIAMIILGEKVKVFASFIDNMESLMFKVTDLVLVFTPIGVLGLMTDTIATYGSKVVGSLVTFIACDWIAALITIVVMYSIMLVFICRMNPFKFWAHFKEPIMIAIATLVSVATLPLGMKTCTEKIGVPKSTTDFVLPLGATANMNGTAVYFGLIVVFTCQLMGIQLSISQYVILVIQSVLMAIGCAAVPSIALVLSATLLTSFGLPIEAIGLVTGIHRIVNTAHTPTNVMGDWVTATCIASLDGTLDREKCVAKL